jgi:flagellar hook-basal body complex protein FliE
MIDSTGFVSSRPVIGELYDSAPTGPMRGSEERRGIAGADERRGPDFGDALLDAVDKAAAADGAADDAATRFAAGDPAIGIHEVIIASEKANIAVRYATTLKNRLVDAYRELMTTQV